MRTTRYKWFWAWNFDREEAWLNEMAAQGLALVAVGPLVYTFEDSAPGEYGVRLELLNDMPGTGKSKRYLEFVEQTGAEYIGSVTRWAYFRKRTAAGAFDLFSDYDSRIRHLNRQLWLLGCLGVAQLSIGVPNIASLAMRESTLGIVAAVLPLTFAVLFCFGFARVNGLKRRLKCARRLYES